MSLVIECRDPRRMADRVPAREEAFRESPGQGLPPVRLRGLRTQPGLYSEAFGERTYIRKRCPCRPVHTKRTFASIARLPITVRDNGEIILIWD